MRSKFLTGAATLALATLVLLVAGPAAPQNWQYHGNATAGAPDFTAGMVGSTLTATSPFWGTRYYGRYPPRYDYRPRR
jgi:hypothetical protein